jgi:hypothetical protein
MKLSNAGRIVLSAGAAGGHSIIRMLRRPQLPLWRWISRHHDASRKRLVEADHVEGAPVSGSELCAVWGCH